MPKTCPYCEEPLLHGDAIERFADQPPFHRECYIRVVLGSAGHQLGKDVGLPCPSHHCFDPPGLTLRQAARVALDVYSQIRHV